MAADVLTSDWMHRIIQAKLTNQLPLTGLTLHLRLFVNDVVPDCFVSGSDLTECTLPGYAPFTLAFATWSINPYPSPASCGWIGSYAPLTFVFDAGGQTIYGLWVDYFAAVNVAWTKRLDAPYVVPAEGGSLQIQLNVTESMCP